MGPRDARAEVACDGRVSAVPVGRERAATAVAPAPPARVRAVVFDKDGVLVNTEPEHERRLRAYLEELGRDASDMPCLYGSNNEATWGWVEPHDEALRERLYQGFRARWHEEPMPYARLLDPEAPALLDALREAGLALGLASASPSGVIDDFLCATGLEGCFDVVLSGEECAATKPAPDVYLRAMERLGASAGETVVVEDSPVGILAAHRAGTFVCAVPLPAGVELDQSLADAHLPSLSALAGLLGL